MNLAMQTVLVDLLVVVSLLLVLMVLLQRPRSDGLGTLSGGALEATLGPNAAGVLRGATAWMGVAFLINSLLLTALM
jgi:preprotein translocase subunit SecG